ncbi:hypothetical protein FMM05_12355 [Flavobacterium zepuense]|uniref:Outer membrane protein beta-barrel domain-containing protein n=1 Tax=Flavobacterium zepuense TaxID=2593302 RepID=A0A552V0E8_9FLAO|nr:hypothetical protein [Flavobacterium zepuense]TRW23944.1 hypothetical protein FMM05_12355 [Flavobacterium zepuense]
MNIFKTMALLCLLQGAATLHAQEKPADVPQQAAEKKYEAGFDGMLAVSYGSDTFGINVGGPSLKYRFSKNFKVGVGAFPSLIVLDKKAVPRLAVSPIIEYKHIMFITPYYGYDTNDKQIWTFGIGYKFI